MPTRIKKEDMVLVIAGKDRDLTKARRVLQVLPGDSKVLVEGANMVRRHTRANPQRNIKGGILEKESPIHISNVMPVDPKTNKHTRVGAEHAKDGRRIRIAQPAQRVLRFVAREHHLLAHVERRRLVAETEEDQAHGIIPLSSRTYGTS